MIAALKLLFKCIVDRFPPYIVKKLESFPESSLGGWSIAVKTRDGKVFREVEVGDGFLGLGYFVHIFGDQKSWGNLPFRLKETVDIEWEGYRVGNSLKRPDNFKDEFRFKK